MNPIDELDFTSTLQYRTSGKSIHGALHLTSRSNRVNTNTKARFKSKARNRAIRAFDRIIRQERSWMQ
jgi:hypothetical protein